VLAGDPLRASPAMLLVRSRLGGALTGRLGVAAAIVHPLLGLDPPDDRPGPLPVGPLGRVTGFGAERPNRIGDAVGVSVVLDLGRGLAPGPPAPGRRRHRPEGLQDIAGAIDFHGQAGGASLLGQGPHHLSILRAEMRVGLQPAVADMLVLAQLPFAVVGPVGLLGGHCHTTQHPSSAVAAAAQDAKHPSWLTASGLLVGCQRCLGLLAAGGGPGKLPAAVTGGMIQLAAQPVPLGPQLRRGQPLEIGAALGCR
jgi:hypothetical protein